MALRNTNTNIPEELQTKLKFKTKKRNERRSDAIPPVLPHAPVKSRPSSINGPQFSIVSQNGEISPDYSYDVMLPYIDQVFIRCGKLGEGSFGEVYKVKDRKTGTYYAIKTLKPSMSEQLFIREIKNNELIGKHKNIVEFFMGWRERNTVYIQFENCDMSVADFAETNTMPEEVLWYLIGDMAQALEYLHGKKMLHLDIKPSNILISKTTFKLSDFGILYNYENNVNMPIISDGDPKYLSCEVLSNIYVPQSDIFSLGITIVELSSNIDLPSNGKLWQQLRHEIMPTEFLNQASRPLQIIVRDMMQLDHVKRPLAKKLQRYQNVKDAIVTSGERTAFMNLDVMNNNNVELDLLQIYNKQQGRNSDKIESPVQNDAKATPSSSRRIRDPRLMRSRCSRNLLEDLSDEEKMENRVNLYAEFVKGVNGESSPVKKIDFNEQNEDKDIKTGDLSKVHLNEMENTNSKTSSRSSLPEIENISDENLGIKDKENDVISSDETEYSGDEIDQIFKSGCAFKSSKPKKEKKEEKENDPSNESLIKDEDLFEIEMIEYIHTRNIIDESVIFISDVEMSPHRDI